MNTPHYIILTLTLLIAAITSTHAVTASTGHIAALSVSDENATTGEVIDIGLEIKPGSGAIYIESMPLTKLDTQMSARLAAEAACERSKADCKQYDFFYVIRTSGGVVGGPSAGAALSVLTYAVLENLPIRNDTAITGALLPGGVVGPVGGVTQKVRGAAAAGYTTVLIPAFDDQDSELRGNAVNDTNETNTTDANTTTRTTSSDAYAKYGVHTTMNAAETSVFTVDRITVVRIMTIDDAIERFTGRKITHVAPLTAPPLTYTADMARIAKTLCDRAEIIRSTIEYSANNTIANNTTNDTNANSTDAENTTNDTRARLADADQQYARARNASEQGAYYTAASKCFGAALISQELVLREGSAQSRMNMLDLVKRNRDTMREALDTVKFNTITDLEIAMIASERLSDVERTLSDINTSDPDPAALAYASERLETARAWYGVLGRIAGAPFDLSPDALDASCRQKLDEARERVNYAGYLFPQSAAQLEESLRSAFTATQRQNYALCILQASQAKAEANAVLTALSVPEQDFPAVTARKAAIARERIAQETAQGTFPVLAYSYSEYADSFSASERASAALYTEYSLELASLPVSFSKHPSSIRVDTRASIIFGLGAIVGLLFGIFAGFLFYRPSKHERANVNAARRRR